MRWKVEHLSGLMSAACWVDMMVVRKVDSLIEMTADSKAAKTADYWADLKVAKTAD